MFKKIKYANGKREIYLGKLRIFKYINQAKFLEYLVKQSLFDAYMSYKHNGGDLFFTLK